MKTLFSLCIVATICISSALAQTTPKPDAEMMQFLSKTIAYPSESRENRVQGTVVIQTRFDESGYLFSHEVLSGEPSLAAQVTETLKKMQENWSEDFVGEQVKAEAYLLTFQFKMTKPQGIQTGIYLRSGQTMKTPKKEVSPIESLSNKIDSNPFSPELYQARAELYRESGIPLLAQRDRLLADYVQSKMLAQLVIVGYSSSQKKLGTSE